MRLFVTAAIVLCACCAVSQDAGGTKRSSSGPKENVSRGQKNDSQAVDLLTKMEEKYGSVQTITGTFDQVREDPSFQERVESTAEFAIMKPNKFRAEYKPPRVSVNLINGEYSYQYVPELKQVNRYRFRNSNAIRDLNYMLLGFGARTEDLLKVYSVKWLTEGVAAGYYGIQLVPRDKDNASFKYITILVTRDERLLPAQFSVGQKDGVRTTANLDISRLKFNASISAREFEPNFPRSAEIVDIE